MSIASTLAAGRQYIRDRFATITIANGYSVAIKTSDGRQDENPLKTPDSLLPRAFIYSSEARIRGIVNPSVGKATSPVTADIWFLMGTRAGNGEEFEDYLSAASAAIYAGTMPAGVRVLFADEPSTFGLTAGGRAILRIPMLIEATCSLR